MIMTVIRCFYASLLKTVVRGLGRILLKTIAKYGFWLAVSRLPKKSLSLGRRSVDSLWFNSATSFGERSAIIVRASSDMDAKEPDITNMPRESAEEAPSVVGSLPLESKQQMILEQRQKMKLAKKIRLKRKRLLRKRRMRKKGRWPPSKMRKLKNV